MYAEHVGRSNTQLATSSYPESGGKWFFQLGNEIIPFFIGKYLLGFIVRLKTWALHVRLIERPEPVILRLSVPTSARHSSSTPSFALEICQDEFPILDHHKRNLEFAHFADSERENRN